MRYRRLSQARSAGTRRDRPLSHDITFIARHNSPSRPPPRRYASAVYAEREVLAEIAGIGSDTVAESNLASLPLSPLIPPHASALASPLSSSPRVGSSPEAATPSAVAFSVAFGGPSGPAAAPAQIRAASAEPGERRSLSLGRSERGETGCSSAIDSGGAARRSPGSPDLAHGRSDARPARGGRGLDDYAIDTEHTDEVREVGGEARPMEVMSCGSSVHDHHSRDVESVAPDSPLQPLPTRAQPPRRSSRPGAPRAYCKHRCRVGRGLDG